MVLSIIVLYQHTYVCYFSSKIRTNLQKMLQICVTIYFYCNCCPLLFSMSLSHNLQPSPFFKLLQTCTNNPFSKIFFALYEKRAFLSKFLQGVWSKAWIQIWWKVPTRVAKKRVGLPKHAVFEVMWAVYASNGYSYFNHYVCIITVILKWN